MCVLRASGGRSRSDGGNDGAERMCVSRASGGRSRSDGGNDGAERRARRPRGMVTEGGVGGDK